MPDGTYTARNEAIYALYMDGFPCVDIAARYGISHQRVSQIANRMQRRDVLQRLGESV